MSFAAFAGGLFNPLTVPAHVLAWLGLGLLIGSQPGGRLVPALCFAAGLAGGLSAIARAVGLTPALDILLVVGAISGALVALAFALPQILSATIAVIAGLALGLDSPPQANSIADATTALIGTGLAACLALAIVVTVTSRLTRGWQRIGLRILGSWIAASAILVLALRFARGMLFTV
jgi:hydrogenase/urease accessory protein HupE